MSDIGNTANIDRIRFRLQGSSPSNPASGYGYLFSKTADKHLYWRDSTGAETDITGLLDAADAMLFKGVIDCSANPNYPAADAGHTYRISVAGKIGEARGIKGGDKVLIILITARTSS